MTLPWEAMATDVSRGAKVLRVRRLGGGLATATFAVDLDRGPTQRLVVKRYRRGDETAPLEWERLGFAQRVALPVPRPVALDLEGRWFGSPAIVMTRLPGSALLDPSDLDGWLGQLAEAMATVHATDTAGASGPMLRPPSPEVWARPKLWRPTPFVKAVVEAIDRNLPRAGWEPVLAHGDFHPGNVIWQRRRISGVIDWSASRLGPRWFEVAYCRADVAVLFGADAADRLRELYTEITSLEPVDLPVFDLVCGLSARQWGRAWLGAYRQQGLTATHFQFANRLTPFLRHAMARLGD